MPTPSLPETQAAESQSDDAAILADLSREELEALAWGDLGGAPADKSPVPSFHAGL